MGRLTPEASVVCLFVALSRGKIVRDADGRSMIARGDAIEEMFWIMSRNIQKFPLSKRILL
jgi:hypothetical protein